MCFQMRKEQVTFERIDGELIIISMDSGKYFSATGSAADVFYLIEKQTPLGSFKRILSNNFSSEVEQSEIDALIEIAIREGLIETCQQPSQLDPELPLDYQRSSWTAPNLIEFSDLQDLILVDPVHDTSLKGWPIEKE